MQETIYWTIPNMSKEEWIEKYCHLYYVYVTINLINNKIYVGQRHTTNEWDRDPYLGSGKILQRAIKKYGRENFKKIIVEYCTKETLDEREIFWIKEFNSRNSEVGYNILVGGQSGRSGENNPFYGKTHSEEVIAKIILAQTGRKHSEEHKKKNSESNKGRKPTEEQNRINSESNKGKHSGVLSGMFGKRGELNHLFGKKQTREQIKKRVENRSPEKNRKESDEKRRKTLSENPELTCYYCGFKSNNKGVINRWHNDNCKQKPGYIPKEKKLKTEEDKIICPHCNFVGSNIAAMKQHHGDNCKQNPNYISKIRELVVCPHCGVAGFSKSNMGRHHFNNCKNKLDNSY